MKPLKVALLVLLPLCALYAGAQLRPWPLAVGQLAGRFSPKPPQTPMFSPIDTPERYLKDWKTVDSLEQQGLVQSALEKVEAIYAKASAAGNADQVVKAMMYRLRLVEYREEDAMLKMLARLDSEAQVAKHPVKPVLHSYLASLYWNYYQQNRWRFRDRTQTSADFDPKDAATWALERLVAEVRQQYVRSLQDPAALRATKIETYHEVLGGASNESVEKFAKNKYRNLRPTLYDLLAHRAVDFMMNTEPDIARPAYRFELDNPAYLAPAATFMGLKLTARDSTDLKFLALGLLQDLMRHHQADPEALADADLKRIKLVYEHLVLPDKDDRYLAALAHAREAYAKMPQAADFAYLEAAYFQGQGESYRPGTGNDNLRFEKRKAFEMAKKAATQYPNTVGANNCLALMEQLQQKTLSLKLEDVAPANQPARVLVGFRNLGKLWFKVVKTSRAEIEKIRELYDEKNTLVTNLATRAGAAAWELAVPADEGDLQDHRFEAKMPGLPVGEYVLLASDQPGFNANKNSLAFAFFTVSDLSYLSRQGNGELEFHVLNRNTGHPMPNVAANLYSREYNYNTRRYTYRKVVTTTTDTNGYLRYATADEQSNNRYISAEFINGKDVLWSERDMYAPYYYNRPKEVAQTQVFFFTDRAIYRPGQTIYFKGIALMRTGERNELLKNQTFNVQLNDANGQQAAQLEVRSNEYGSFAGTFTAPTGGLNGRMSLRCLESYHQFSVEDYKRPKFEVKFEPVKGTFKLGETLTAEGKAAAYSGANIDGAEVKYRVVRRARFPNWWWWWYGSYPSSPEVEIANGAAKTDENGVFKVEFVAQPDRGVAVNSRPVFTYEVTADVTDLNGETRSGNRTVSVGYDALELGSTVPELLDLDGPTGPLELATTNLDGEFEPAKGSYTLHRLQAPARSFRARTWEQPDLFALGREEFYRAFPHDVYADEDRLPKWPKAGQVVQRAFDTEKGKQLDLGPLAPGAYVLELSATDRFGTVVKNTQYFTVFSAKAPALAYPQGAFFTPLAPERGPGSAALGAAGNPPPASDHEPGDVARLLAGSSLADLRVLYEVEERGQIVKREWLKFGNEQRILRLPVEEKHRGNFGAYLTFVRHGRAYQYQTLVSVPHTNRALDISFETFRDKLQPGQAEEWRLKVRGKAGDKLAAELVAGLYDASLDAFAVNSFNFNILRNFGLAQTWQGYTFGDVSAELLPRWPAAKRGFGEREYDFLYDFNVVNTQQYMLMGGRMATRSKRAAPGAVREEVQMEMAMAAPAPQGAADEDNATGGSPKMEEEKNKNGSAGESDKRTGGQTGGQTKPDALDQVKARTNFNETAFFFPQIQTDAEGNLVIKFTIPEALTRWKMLGFAHTQDLKYGFAQRTLVTQKDLMVVPNPPRFFRERDAMTFSAKITNLSDRDLDGTARIQFFDALTMQPVDAKLYPAPVEAMSMEALVAQRSTKPFSVKKGQSTAVDWAIQVPDGQVQALTYRVVAQAGNFSDGEEMTLPVLTNRMLVTETLPLPVRGGQTKTFELAKLVKNESKTLRHQSLTLEFTPNPAWYAVQALPYMMEYPYECAEQVFSRFYANSIATHVVQTQPTIKNVFEAWKNAPPSSGPLASNLEKNQELKALLLEETPWVRQAQNEAERKRNVGVLFDLVRMTSELDQSLTKLEKMQVTSGGFPWFPGMPDSRWVTQHIVAGMGHLDKLGVLTVRPDATTSTQKYNPGIAVGRSWAMVNRAVGYLDERNREDYEELVRLAKKGQIKLEDKHLGYTQIHYLYARSFFRDVAVAPRNREAYDYYLKQAEKYWFQNGLYGEGMIALVLHRHDRAAAAKDVVKSLRERALTSEEMGMYWKNMMNRSYWWYEQPIETQALMVEVFGEVAKDDAAVNDLKVWLLKQKQTQDWKTTKATAEACYALLLRGTNWLTEDPQIDIKIGGQKQTIRLQNGPNSTATTAHDIVTGGTKLEPGQNDAAKPEAGTGYFKASWVREAVRPEMGRVTVSKGTKGGVAWGGLYWQYFEDLDKITPAETPLKLQKQLFLQENSPTGPVLKPLANGTVLRVGDLVKVRIELRVDRAMEYVHLKDMRAAGFEPINVLSRYKWQDGLGYYESTRDAATNFFFGWLPQGTWVFEYPLRATHAGEFSNGITSIQCMYAPEFSSHSEGIRVRVER
jgi:hypothetical protein